VLPFECSSAETYDGGAFLNNYVPPHWTAPPDFPAVPPFPGAVPDAETAAFVREQLVRETRDEREDDAHVVYEGRTLPDVRLLPLADLHRLLEAARPELNLICLGQAPSWRHRAFFAGRDAEAVLGYCACTRGWLHPETWFQLHRWVCGAVWPIPWSKARPRPTYDRLVADYALTVLVPEAAVRVMAALEAHRPRAEVLAQADEAMRRGYRSFGGVYM
jgi:hypothetical protein